MTEIKITGGLLRWKMGWAGGGGGMRESAVM